MRKLLAFALSLMIILSCGNAAAQSRKERRAKKKAQAEQAEAQSAHASAPAKQPKAKEKVPTRTTEPYCPELNRNLTPAQIDSLVALWREKQTLQSYDTFFSDYIDVDAQIPTGDTTPDSVYANRLRALVSPVQLPFNPVVKSYIRRYVDTRYGTINRVLSLSRYYFPLIEEELIKADLPVELRALPIIESALSTTATSPMGAVGLWQFMPATGKSYGLEINSFVDERRDPVLATRAACRYLKDLYRIYHDWTLAIAAYNCGPGNVNKALARAGNGTTFWDIYEYLPRETRGYVPAFVGASYAYAYHQQHGIRSENPPMPLATDTIRVTRLLHLGQVASTLDIPIETLRTLNPQYKMDIIPATIKSYTLVLPQHYLCQYIANEEEIHQKDSTYLKEYLNPVNIEKKKIADATPAYTTYTVKRGDTLGTIARRYKTTTAQIMKLNKLKNANKLREGQKLKIPVRR